MAKISFITFTRNSADRIANLLEHVKDIVDEIIVIMVAVAMVPWK